MSISVIKSGLMDTIQDLGRFGYSKWGINPGGVMDRYAAQVANMLVGNDENEAIMEIHFPGPQLLFEQNTLISITGACFSATLNDEELPLWQPIVVRRNAVLHFTKRNNGARAYLAVHGGFAAEKWLDSYSTNIKAGSGGWHGRRLEKGDEIPFNESHFYFSGLLKENSDYRLLSWRADGKKIYDLPHEIYFIEGAEWNLLEEAGQHDFLQSNFIIHPSSDRMGYNLKGPSIHMQEKKEMLSTGVDYGTIQLLPSGELVVLMADHQTTGGYPRIGHVISAHLPKLAQLRPSDCVQFIKVDMQTAEEMLFFQQKELAILKRACAERLKDKVC